MSQNIPQTKAFTGFTETMARATSLLDVHGYITKARGRPPLWASDILRATHVLVIASLDSYIHDVISENTYKFLAQRKGKNLPKELLDTLRESVPYEKLLEIWHEERVATHINTAIRKRNAERSFMKPDKIENTLKLLGIKDFWALAAKRLRCRKDGLKTRFLDYSIRRDKIAHEGDIWKSPIKKGRLKAIQKPYIIKCIDDVKKVVQIVDNLVTEQVAVN